MNSQFVAVAVAAAFAVMLPMNQTWAESAAQPETKTSARTEAADTALVESDTMDPAQIATKVAAASTGPATSPRPPAELPKWIGKVSFTRSWIDSQPKAQGGEEFACLAEALYFEARGEAIRGQFAVAEVILNRTRDGQYPKTVCGVVRQGAGNSCQFSYACDGKSDAISEKRAFERVAKVARATLDGAVPALTGGATHFHARHVQPSWANTYVQTAEIGSHVFYRDSYRTASVN